MPTCNACNDVIASLQTCPLDQRDCSVYSRGIYLATPYIHGDANKQIVGFSTSNRSLKDAVPGDPYHSAQKRGQLWSINNFHSLRKLGFAEEELHEARASGGPWGPQGTGGTGLCMSRASAKVKLLVSLSPVRTLLVAMLRQDMLHPIESSRF